MRIHKRTILMLLTTLVSVLSFSQINRGQFDPYNYGAKGDGQTNDTKAIQAAIDHCHLAGGGKVLLHNGRFLSGTVYMKSNVTLDIDAGAVLLGSKNLEDYPVISSLYPSYKGNFVTNKMLIYAEDAKSITICGRGTINGQGDHWVDGPYGSPSFSVRPRIIHFRGCRNVFIRDVTLKNSGSWVQSYQSCNNLVIEGITVDSRPNKDIEKPRFTDAPGRNNDGLDLIDCQHVKISHCYIYSGDDAICLKSFSPDEICGDITITDCIVSSNASGIKIGTESSGTFKDININNCEIFDTRVDAISIMTVDGARIERIFVSNITARNIKGSAIFIRLGNRNRLYRKDVSTNTPWLKDVTIENIQGTSISSEYGCSISGIPEMVVENVVLRNINLRFEGGGKMEDSFRQIPEKEKGYPNGLMFGTLPAYGFFIRHVKNIALENITLTLKQDDQRPAIYCDDVEQLSIDGLNASRTLQTTELIQLINSPNAKITRVSSTESIPLNSFPALATDPAIEVKKIWDVAQHNAFTDLIRYNGKFYCTFREGTGHVPGEKGEDGKIRILISEAGEKWESLALLAKKDYDLRDSKLSVTPDGRLMVLMGGTNYDGNDLVSRLTHASFFDPKENTFSPPQPIDIDKKIRSLYDWLWRVRWFNGIGYGIVYQILDKETSKAFLLKTKDGIKYSLVSQLDVDGFPNESTVYMNPDKEMIVVVRREGGDRKGYIGFAKPPYKQWEWNDLGVQLGGPNIIPYNNIFILGTRSYENDKRRTALYFTEKKGPAKKFLELPSGGDTSYPGMLNYQDILWVSYYSTHEGKSSIYLAKIPMVYVNNQYY